MASVSVVQTLGACVLRHRVLVLFLCLGGLCSVAIGDKIVARGNYSVPVDKITGFHNGTLQYLSPSGREMDKPVQDILQITIDGQDVFNQAEQRRLEKKISEAATLYDTVVKADAPPWLIALARTRTTGLAKAGVFPQGGAPIPASRPANDSGMQSPPNPGRGKTGELEWLRAEVERLRRENAQLRGAFDRSGAEAGGGSEKGSPPDGENVEDTATKAIWPVVSSLIQGLREAQDGTTLQREELTKKAFADAKASLTGKTFSLSFPIVDLTKQGDGILVTFDAPAELAQYDAPPKFRGDMTIKVPTSDAVRFKKGDVFTFTGRMRCVKAGTATTPNDIGLLDGELWWLVTNDYKYAVHSAKPSQVDTTGDSEKEGTTEDISATKKPAKAGAITIDQIVSILVQGSAKAQKAETSLLRDEHRKKVSEEVNTRLSRGTFEVSYPIRNIDRSGTQFRVRFDHPVGLPTLFYQRLDSVTIAIPEADALKVRPGWVLTIRCNATYGANSGRNATENTLFGINSNGLGDPYLVATDCTYTVRPPRAGGQ